MSNSSYVNLGLLCVALACFALASCATPEVAVATTTAAVASAVALIDALGPLLPPETLAKLQVTASQIDGTVQATATAVGTLADAIAQLKAATSSQLAGAADKTATLFQQLAGMPSREEVYLVGAGSGAAGTAASRALSAMKARKAS